MQEKQRKEKILIRKYIVEDAQDLANIYYNTIHLVNVRDYNQQQINVWAPETSKETARWLKKFERTSPFVALINHKVVGFAEFEPSGHIDCFYCHHEWIGYGVGSALMEAIYASAAQQGIKSIFAEVSITAKPFFDRCRFTTVTQQTIERKGIFLTNYKMEKFI
ncbi:putative N-acetyltransferase YafP [Chlamydiales bacterium STE3]|nr:putative N-acetyltransferase YafP [Chlamydiales bacterium STE3]